MEIVPIAPFRTDENAIPVEPVWVPQRRHHPAYDPLLDNEPELARTLAASVKQRIAFGQGAGEKVRRIGSGFGSEGEGSELKGSRCASVNGFSLHADTEIPAHRCDQLERLIRYTGRWSRHFVRTCALHTS